MVEDTFVEVCQHDERFFACPICWPVDPELMPAFRGLAGEFVRSFVPYTEAHPTALLATFLTLAGNRFGPRPHARVGSVCHPGRLFMVIVAETSVGRKGMSWAETVSVFERATPQWRENYVFSGFGSGEGVIARVAERMNPGADDLHVVRDPRLVVHEAEFVSLLRVAGRDGSTLSPIIRDAWDGTTLQNNVKRERIVAPSGHMVSLLAHVTKDELRRELTRSDVASGFGNRFDFCGDVRRTRKIAHPKTLDPTAIADELNTVTTRAAGVEHLRFTEAGADAWTLAYDFLEDDAESAGGLVGPLLARGSAQTLRLAVVYALLDGSDRIGVEHVEAALAFWRHCARSVRGIFGEKTGNPIADVIAEKADAAGTDGITRTEISAALGRNYSKTEIDVAVDELVRSGRYRSEDRPTGGRPRTVLLRDETNEVDERRPA